VDYTLAVRDNGMDEGDRAADGVDQDERLSDRLRDRS